MLNRSVLVRILVTQGLETRDAVIRATSRQTSVPAAWLRATDEVQRKIEAHFLAQDWYYDRRKTYYRNLGKTPERIVSIPLLAQATMAMGLWRADNSRTRPSSLLKRDDDYRTVFSASVPLPVYLWLAQAQKAIDSFLVAQPDITAAERTNLRFHLSMLAAARIFGARVFNPSQLKDLAEKEVPIEQADLAQCLADLNQYYADFLADSGDPFDKAAKGSGFVDYVGSQAFV